MKAFKLYTQIDSFVDLKMLFYFNLHNYKQVFYASFSKHYIVQIYSLSSNSFLAYKSSKALIVLCFLGSQGLWNASNWL